MRIRMRPHRRRALSLMVDRCIIRQPDSWAGEVRAEGTVAWQYADSDQVPCRIKVDNTEPQTVVVGGEITTIVRLTVSLPIEIFPEPDQVLTVVSSVDDPDLAGRRFDVLAAGMGTQVTARRVSCQEHR